MCFSDEFFSFAPPAQTWKIDAINRALFSWERGHKRGRQKPFFLRRRFYWPLGLVTLTAVLAWAAWAYFSARFERRAAEFDLTQLERMEAASIIYDRDGKELGKIFIQNRHPISLENVSPMMVKAVVAAEDNKFFEHHGVDYAGVVRAAITNYRRGKISQGASTVTQQLARNSFELRERTYQRKLVEMFLALRIEKNFPKAKIMELYLNRVYFGSGFYGVEAAARGYFGRSAKELSTGQCAMLAGLLKSPQFLSPWNNKEGATLARNFVLKRMKEQGLITGGEYKEQVGLPLYVMKRTNPFKVSYAIDYIRQQAVAALGFRRAMNGGFRIHTTLDSQLQRTAEQSVRETLAKVESRPDYGHVTFEAYRKFVQPIEQELNRGNMLIKMPEPKYLQAAAMALENSTGGVLAMVGGRDFKHSEYNRATMARRPAGTAFTPFVFAAAYEKGIFPGEVVDDGCIDNRFVMVGGDSGILGEWGVERAENEYEGPIPAREALAKGKNAATVRLGLRTGLDQVKKVALGAGIESPLRNYANAFLGSSEATLEELALAYTIFPNGGLRAKRPHIIEEIQTAEGKQIFKAEPQKVKAISAEAAWQVNEGLEDVLRAGVGSVAFSEFGLKDAPVAGKPGTSYNFTDTYFFGYNSSVTCAVWVGFDRPTQIYRGAFGKDLALPIWARIMNTAAGEFPAVKLSRPDNLKAVEVCRRSGLLATPRCARETDGKGHGTFTEYGTTAQLPKIRCDIHGGGVRNYAREYDQEKWPRAAAAVDLSTIRPVAVVGPTLLGLNDVYASVRPATERFDDAIPVARAIAVNATAGQQADAAAAAEASGKNQAAAAAPATEPEVRKAEAVRPLDTPLDAPSIQAPTPEPITF
ncbi:MAG TPA: transglycosylase domain-containing protein [Terrimicrobiaceae bacterium]